MLRWCWFEFLWMLIVIMFTDAHYRPQDHEWEFLSSSSLLCALNHVRLSLIQYPSSNAPSFRKHATTFNSHALYFISCSTMLRFPHGQSPLSITAAAL